MANYEDLEIKRIKIFTHANDAGSGSNYDIRPSNLSFLEWKAAPTGHRRCFTISIPDNIVREGVRYVKINSKAFDTLYLHKEGTLMASISGLGSSLKARYADLYRAAVTHESIELLDYDGKHCNNDNEYNYDQCQQDYIYKV